jgi:hypothetical protein
MSFVREGRRRISWHMFSTTVQVPQSNNINTGFQYYFSPLHYLHPHVPRFGIELIQRIERAQNKITRGKIVIQTLRPRHRSASGSVCHCFVHVLWQHLWTRLFEIRHEVCTGEVEELFDVSENAINNLATKSKSVVKLKWQQEQQPKAS